MSWRNGWVEQVSDEAIDAVNQRMAEIGAVAVEGFKSRYPAAVSAWRFRLEVADQAIEVDLWLPRDFPWGAPRVVLVDPPTFPSIPHVETDGRLCLLPASAEWSTADPVGFVERQILDAHSLLSDGLLGRNRDDFRAEPQSYWLDDSGWNDIKSLLDREGPSRPIDVWAGKLFTLVGDDPEAMSDWLRHRFPNLKADPHFTRGLLCWLDHPPLPAELPKSGADLIELLRLCDLVDQMPEVIGTSPEAVTVVIGFPTPTGASYLAITAFPSRSGRKALFPNRDWLAQGFRPAKVPGHLVQLRFNGRIHLARRSVERCDASWIHGRDTNPEIEDLKTATVAIVGCGSLGSNVARLLAQAGVGAFTLIDPERLTAANTGRHLLGSQSVGQAKVNEVGRRLRTDFPHIYRVNALQKRWQDAVDAEPRLLDEIDLVVSTVGSWTTESLLDAWLRERDQRVVYGWVEPEAAGGQSVMIDHSAGLGCLACGMSAQGIPNFRVTSWPDPKLVQEPACGAFFQPYGAIQLERGSTSVAGLSLDALLDRAAPSTHRAWAGSQGFLDRAGGGWSAEWVASTNGIPANRELDLAWAVNEACRVCGG
mgnify:CR=1 FL=1|tara:strand:- start:16020 stop:17801 length:1782 start_codon:yes stop_codon:yes gene_type:complete